MRLDSLVLQPTAVPASGDLSGTLTPPAGVMNDERPEENAARARDRRERAAAMMRGMLLVATVCVTLLGQGERSRVDPRFVSPSATLSTYWTALRTGDAAGAWECLVEGRHDLPLPGMLWFMPPTDDLSLTAFHSLPVTHGRMLVSYEVRYRPTGSSEHRHFRTADELVRMRGEWRIARPLGEASMPAIESTPRPVDS